MGRNSGMRKAEQRWKLKNGWDLPAGEVPPLTGRKQALRRAYELLVLREDDSFYPKQGIQTTAAPHAGGQPFLSAASFSEEHTKSGSAGKASEEGANSADSPSGETVNEDTAGRMAAAKRTTAEEENPFISEREQDALLREMTIPETEWKQKKRTRRRILLLVAVVILAVVAGRLMLGPPILTANLSGYKDVKITVVGIRKQPFAITAGELAKMKKSRLQVEVPESETPEGEEAEKGEAIGPTLRTFLKHYGKSTNDYKVMRAYTENGNAAAYVRSMQEQTIILSVANGSSPLGEKQAPLRIAVDDQEAGDWTGWVRKLVFIK